jgi:beta-glucosidase
MHARSIVISAAVVLLATLPLGLAGAAQGNAPPPIYLNTDYTFAERAADLVARLTPTQRASQLVSSQASEISNLANPLLLPTQAVFQRNQITLAASASAGDTTIKVSAITGMAAGRTMRVDSGGTPETVTISSVGTAAGTAGTLVLPAAAGDTTINVSTISGATVGHQYRVDVPPNLELGTIATVGTAAGTAGTMPIGASAGDTVLNVSTISGATVGQKYRIDAPPNLEVGTVAAVGTAAGTAGTLPIGASVGDTTIYVSTISGAAAGNKYRVDAPPNMEVPTIASVGTAAATATTLPAGASAGDTNIKVASVSGMTVGHKVRVDTGATIEIGTIATVGTAAATATTLAAASNVGDTNIKVASVTGMTAGHMIRVDTGSNMEIGTITVVGTSGSGGTGITLAAPLTLAHASGAGAQDLGTGVNLVAPLAQAHAIGAGAQDLGTGITLTAPLTLAHAIGAAIQGLGTGITLSAPLGSAHAVGAAIQAAGSGITLAAPLTGAHAYGAAVQDTGTGVTFTPALTGAHSFGGFVDQMTGIPAYGWWNEALHGINAQTYGSGNATTLSNTTSYPIDLSRGASWDPALTYEVAKAESDEARELVPGNKLNLDFYSPTVNIGRDPRWGRNDESYGEDPLLEAKIASQFVNGMEGKDMNGVLLPDGNGFYKATTTLKHYALNNTEGSGSGDPNGRLNVDTHADERTIREYYTMPFRKIIQASQNGAIMSSYNSVNGDPAAANVHLIDTLGRETFGFQGYYTGDCDAVNQINPRHHWQPDGLGHVATVVEQFAYTLGSGEDAECNAGYSTNSADNYRGPTSANTSYGGLMNAIGLQLTTPNGTTNVNDVDVSATRMFTNRMKLGEFNSDSTVPWLTEAVARDKSYGVYPWVSTTAPTETAERLDLARRSAQAGIVLLKNETITRKDSTVGKLLPITVPPTGDFKVAVLGALANTVTLGGYSSGQSGNGAANNVTAYAGIKAAIQAINPAAQVDFLRGFTGTSTSASSCCSTIDPAAVAAAADYDYAIVYTGIDSGVAAEDRDRTTITLTGQQGQLIAQVAAVNPNTIGVMQGDPFDVTPFEPVTPALLWSSYNGQRQGEALADVLLGVYNPSGRLPETFYKSVDDLPPTSSYAIRPVGTTGRTYMYFNGPVSYPFGYGLSYTTFGFSNLHLSQTTPSADDTIQVSVDVTNTGSLDGNEIVQMYVNTPNADPTLERPIKRLEGFEKVFLNAGQTKTVTLPLKIANLAFFNEADNRFEVDQGVYGIQISTSSADADIQQQATIDVHGTLTQTPSVVTTRPRIADSDAPRGITQRVMFPEGVEIDPGVTVAMNDDTLVGWIAPGQSKPLPHGLDLSFSSDRPSVVSVKGDKIRTVSNGAATVTATAKYHGASASTTFVVRVLSDLTDLKVGGVTVRGFNPDVFDYDVTLPPGATDVPQVAATAQTGTVDVTQATAVPGVATVTSTGPEGIVATYTVNFSPTPAGDEFDGSSLDPKWTLVRPDPANLAVGGGSLTITPQTGDLTTTSNSAKNLVLQPALGDWTMTSKLTFSAPPNAATQQGGIIAYQDDDNYLKFDLEATSSTNIQLKTSLEDSFQTNPVASANPIQVNQTLNTTPMTGILPADNTIWLRMTKEGSRYSTSYSLDGDTWVPVWSTGATLRNVKVGLLAFNGAAATGPQVAFDFFHLTVGADQQLESLSDFVGFLGLDKGLTKDLQNKLDGALKQLGKQKDACKQIDDFLVKVLDQAGKNNPKLTVAQAEQLLYANEIEINLGCLDPASPVPKAERDLLELGATIDGLGLEKGVADDLGNRVREASKQLAQGKLDQSCKQLSDLAKKIDEQARKGKLTPAQQALLGGEVAAISTDLGCPVT